MVETIRFADTIPDAIFCHNAGSGSPRLPFRSLEGCSWDIVPGYVVAREKCRLKVSFEAFTLVMLFQLYI